MLVAVAGDSISAGSPLWPKDERSRWQWWAARRDARLEFRTAAAYGKRTDEIARFVAEVAADADVLVVQGGINARATREIERLNVLIAALDAPLLPFHDTLAAVDEWSDDGDHPSVEGHRLLGDCAAKVLLEL